MTHTFPSRLSSDMNNFVEVNKSVLFLSIQVLFCSIYKMSLLALCNHWAYRKIHTILLNRENCKLGIFHSYEPQTTKDYIFHNMVACRFLDRKSTRLNSSH